MNAYRLYDRRADSPALALGGGQNWFSSTNPPPDWMWRATRRLGGALAGGLFLPPAAYRRDEGQRFR